MTSKCPLFLDEGEKAGEIVIIFNKIKPKRAGLLALSLFLPFFLGFSDSSFYRDFLTKKMMIAQIKIYNGDTTAKQEMKELIKEARSRGFSIPRWAPITKDGYKGRGKLRKGCYFYDLTHQDQKPTDRFEKEIKRAGGTYGLPPALIKAVIKVESNFNEQAISKAGAMGCMQLMPTTAEDMDVYNPFDPLTNIFGGSKYLRLCLEEFGSIKKALSAYHCGPQTVRQNRNIPPETKLYVKDVLKYYRQYKKGDR